MKLRKTDLLVCEKCFNGMIATERKLSLIQH